MRSRTTRSFREAFRALPPEVQERARRAFRLWRDNPDLPGLRFKRVGSDVSVSLSKARRFSAMRCAIPRFSIAGATGRGSLILNPGRSGSYW